MFANWKDNLLEFFSFDIRQSPLLTIGQLSCLYFLFWFASRLMDVGLSLLPALLISTVPILIYAAMDGYYSMMLFIPGLCLFLWAIDAITGWTAIITGIVLNVIYHLLFAGDRVQEYVFTMVNLYRQGVFFRWLLARSLLVAALFAWFLLDLPAKFPGDLAMIVYIVGVGIVSLVIYPESG